MALLNETLPMLHDAVYESAKSRPWSVFYKKESVSLDLKLSGGYEGGSIEKEKLEFPKLPSGEEEWGNERLQKEKEEFLKKARQLGFDFGK